MGCGGSATRSEGVDPVAAAKNFGRGEGATVASGVVGEEPVAH